MFIVPLWNGLQQSQYRTHDRTFELFSIAPDDDSDGNDADALIPKYNQSPLPSLYSSLNSGGSLPLDEMIKAEDKSKSARDIDINIPGDKHDLNETFFDLIVGTGFISEAAAVEEVGGDPSFLLDYDEDEDKWDEWVAGFL